MNVKKLIEELSLCNPDAEVIFSIDSEGNRYKKVEEVCNECVFEVLECGEIEIGFSELTSQLQIDGFTEEEMMSDGKSCVILYPVN